MGWATCCPLLIEVDSNVRRSYLSFGKEKYMWNEMAFAPTIARLRGFCRVDFISFGRVYCMLQVFKTGIA
ncbi:hypothetical protein CXB51_025382 [Gossypium anomalum]|uniref:Uncharacterized protein n=1 Tax=Gossypium anomalum TaxID=47600 RepID=A0A8J6CM66_9ROSI|nr:hypothetical protein CXB51_025382 [Gossypium anomalum]